MKKRIYFIVPSLEAGGSERVITHLVNNLDKGSFDITLVLLQKKGYFLSHIAGDVHIIDIDVAHLRKAIFKIVHLLRKNRPDIVFSTLSHLNIIMSILRICIPRQTYLIARESSVLSVINKKERFTTLFNLLCRFFYKKIDKIICQSDYMKNDLVHTYRIPAAKIDVINNPVDFIDIDSSLQKETVSPVQEGIQLLAVGRLSQEKRFKILLDVFSQLPIKQKSLIILGEGPEYDSLLSYAEILGLKSKVCFMGFQENPYIFMKHADCLLLTSEYEGFPNVVIEAHACGLPVIAFDCPGGISEIIENGKNGWLIPDNNIEEMVKKIEYLVENPLNKKNIQERTEKKYNLQKIIREYTSSILNVNKAYGRHL